MKDFVGFAGGTIDCGMSARKCAPVTRRGPRSFGLRLDSLLVSKPTAVLFHPTSSPSPPLLVLAHNPDRRLWMNQSCLGTLPVLALSVALTVFALRHFRF